MTRKILLKNNRTGHVISAILTELKPAHKKMWEEQWKRPLSVGSGSAFPDRSWDWLGIFQAVFASPGFSGHAITCQGELQGLAILSTSGRESLDGKPLVYIEYLATAPWNRSTHGAQSRFSWIGTWLVYSACQLSKRLKRKGRIALSSEPGAEKFYEEKIGMERKGRNAEGEAYFEFDEAGSADFMAELEGLIRQTRKKKN